MEDQQIESQLDNNKNRIEDPEKGAFEEEKGADGISQQQNGVDEADASEESELPASDQVPVLPDLVVAFPQQGGYAFDIPAHTHPPFAHTIVPHRPLTVNDKDGGGYRGRT